MINISYTSIPCAAIIYVAIATRLFIPLDTRLYFSARAVFAPTNFTYSPLRVLTRVLLYASEMHV